MRPPLYLTIVRRSLYCDLSANAVVAAPIRPFLDYVFTELSQLCFKPLKTTTRLPLDMRVEIQTNKMHINLDFISFMCILFVVVLYLVCSNFLLNL